MCTRRIRPTVSLCVVASGAHRRLHDDISTSSHRIERLASTAQRRALEATHDTCAFDECAVAFHACQIHHIEYWESGGPTDLDNMVPLCSRHHHAAHEGGWTLTLKTGTRQLDARPPNRILAS